MSGRGTDVREELRKRSMDLCCLQEVRWKGQRSRFMDVKGRRYKLRWSGNCDGTGGVGVSVKEELCKKVVEVRRKSDRVKTVVMALQEAVVRIVCRVHKVAERVQRKSVLMMIWGVSGIFTAWVS